MIGLVRATAICATLALGLTAAGAADKAFKRDELADLAVKLEAQIKSEAGRSPNPPRRSVTTPMPPSGGRTSASACRSSARSPPPRPKTAPTG